MYKFNLQLFGQDDIYTAENILKIGLRRRGDLKIEYVATLQNPLKSVNQLDNEFIQDVQTAAQYLVNNGIFLDNQNAESYTSVGAAYVEEKSNLDLDLS